MSVNLLRDVCIAASTELKPLYPKTSRFFFYVAANGFGSGMLPYALAAAGELGSLRKLQKFMFSIVDDSLSPGNIGIVYAAIQDCSLLPKTRFFFTRFLASA